jgi:AP-1 complex subunit mu
LTLIEFLKNFIDLLTGYFKEVEEESIKDNFVIIYELLDEIIDNGYIQCVDINFLKEYIKTDYHELVKKNRDSTFIQGPQVGKKITWRKEGIVHKENEFYMDIFENVYFTMDMSGTIIKSEIKGVVKAKSKLSGMPIVQMGLNEANALENAGLDGQLGINFDDVKFHNCVDLAKFENTKNIIFTPPDGDFELMTYFIKTKVKPLFSITLDTVKYTKSVGEFVVTLTTNFKKKSIANDIKVYIPIPCDSKNTKFKTREGTVDYLSDQDCICWSIPFLKGEELLTMEYSFSLPTLVSRKIKSQSRKL